MKKYLKLLILSLLVFGFISINASYSFAQVKIQGKEQTKKQTDVSQPQINKNKIIFDVTLAVGKSMTLEFVLEPGLNLVEIEFAPETGPKVTVAPKKYPATPAGLKQYKADAYKERIKKANQISVQINLGNSVYRAIPARSFYHYFILEVNNPSSKLATATLTVKNITTMPVKGKAGIRAENKDKKMARIMADKQKNVEMSIEKMENTDLLKVYYHTLKRHLNNYPGGKSPVDKLFSEKMTRKNISNATLQAIQKGLQPFEDRITAKVKKNEIKKLPLNKGVTKGMFYKPKTVQFDPSVELCKKVLGKTGTIEIANKPGLFVGCNGFGLASYEKKYAKEGFLYPLARTSKNIGGIVFNFVPGLSDNQYVTIEVEKKPEYKLSCNGGFTWFTKDPQFGNSTKTFKIIPALNGKPFPWVSIESVASPEMYLAVSGPECLPQEWDLSGCFYFQKKCESNIALCNEIASFKINILGDIEEQPYSISLLGIKSEKCRDDIGNCMTPADWLWSCCDPEEPFVAWSVFGGNNFNAGVTEPAIDVDGGSYYGPYQQNTVLLDNRIVSGPLFLIAQVREDDDGGPSQKEVADAIIGGIDFLMSFASGDVLGSIQDGLEFAIDLGKVITDLLYGADDLYIPVVAYWSNSQELLKLTSGVEKTIDFESLINLCDKSVDHAAIKCANVVNSGGGKEWVLYFLIMRNEKGTNIW